MKKVNQYFKDHPEVSHVFLTADGFLFLDKRTAQAHANTLEKKEVQAFGNTGRPVDTTPAQAYLENQPNLKGVWVTLNRELFTCENKAKAVDPQAVYVIVDQTKEDTSQEKQEVSKEEVLELLKNTELVKENYKAMKSLIATLKLEVIDQKATTFIKVLEAFKSTLNPI